MHKILLTCCLALLLTACSSQNQSDNDTANSAKSGIKYKISDDQAKKWVSEKNKVQQCLFPKGNSHIATKQPFLYQMAIYNRPLLQVIGEKDYQTLSVSPASQQYAAAKLRKFNHNKKVKLDKAWCASLRKEYSTLVKLAQMPTQSENKTTLKKTSSKKKSKKSVTQTVKINLPNVESNLEANILDEEIQIQDSQPSGKTSPSVPMTGPSPSSYDGDDQIRVNTEPFKSEVIHF